ncbi:unnamed protein product [Prunus armeniaca]
MWFCSCAIPQLTAADRDNWQGAVHIGKISGHLSFLTKYVWPIFFIFFIFYVPCNP